MREGEEEVGKKGATVNYFSWLLGFCTTQIFMPCFTVLFVADREPVPTPHVSLSLSPSLPLSLSLSLSLSSLSLSQSLFLSNRHILALSLSSFLSLFPTSFS